MWCYMAQNDKPNMKQENTKVIQMKTTEIVQGSSNVWRYASESVSASDKEKRGVLYSGVSAAWQRPTSRSPSYREREIQDLKFGGVSPSAIFTRFGTQWFLPLLTPDWLRWWRRQCITDSNSNQKHFVSRGIYALAERWRGCVKCGGGHTTNTNITVLYPLLQEKSYYITFTVIWMTLVCGSHPGSSKRIVCLLIYLFCTMP